MAPCRIYHLRTQAIFAAQTRHLVDHQVGKEGKFLGLDGWTGPASFGHPPTLFRAQKGKYKFTRFDQADEKIRGETGMKRQCELPMEEGNYFNCDGYYYIPLQGKFASSNGDSGHAIAVHLDSGGNCLYFDPNVGEYETDTIEETLAELGSWSRATKSGTSRSPGAVGNEAAGSAETPTSA